MANLQSNLNLTLDANRTGTTLKVISEALSLANVDFNQDTQDVIMVAGGVSNLAISLGGLTTATTLLLISDQPLTVKINGETTGHLFNNLLMTGAAITALTVSNGNSQMATLRVYLLG